MLDTQWDELVYIIDLIDCERDLGFDLENGGGPRGYEL